MGIHRHSRIAPVCRQGHGGAKEPFVRPRVLGKYLYIEREKYYIRGVTYGPFRPMADGSEYDDPATVTRDFRRMREAGVNTVRTYTVPPRWLLDAAMDHDLRVMVGLPWQQHVAFLQDRNVAREIEVGIRTGVRSCSGHPALLAYAVGNEVPTGVVRWHGHRQVERYIERLCAAARDEDPEALVAYVNYPSTEYLELPFLDFYCYNVYLEAQPRFEAYLARLQNLAGDKPLVLAETGLDSRRNGLAEQAAAVDWQVRSAFAGGCAGVFVFAWTDEWHRNGQDIEDWDFGLTDRQRVPKPALSAVQAAYAACPFPPGLDWPRVSVVVCTYRGSRTLAECLDGLQQVRYPNVETIVVNDGSDPEVAAVASGFDVRLMNLPHVGLGEARNAGMEAATGTVVAYLDDDAHPDVHWLHYLAQTFRTTDYAAVGGPNVPPPTGDWITESIAHAPGGPVHVLVTDRDAEHIPGCNMAFRKEALQAVGGFDPRFRVAGDDVDICWRFKEAGLKIGFNPGAMVWHHRRGTVRAYWRQQAGYGRAEAMLERKWPSRYNSVGHPAWTGRIYSNGPLAALRWGRPRVYQGTWGSALFQSLYEPARHQFGSIASMPEWYLVILALAGLLVLAPLWPPLLNMWPILLLVVGFTMGQAMRSALVIPLEPRRRSTGARWAVRALIGMLFLLQPLSRLVGRLGAGLTPWRRRRPRGFALPAPRTWLIWSERWRTPVEWIEDIESRLDGKGAGLRRGGAFDRWDLDVRGGTMGSVRLRVLVEEHGAGKQLVRVRAWPNGPWFVSAFLLLSATLAAVALRDLAWEAFLVFAGVTAGSIVSAVSDWGGSLAVLTRVLRDLKNEQEVPCAATKGEPTAAEALAQAGQTVANAEP